MAQNDGLAPCRTLGRIGERARNRASIRFWTNVACRRVGMCPIEVSRPGIVVPMSGAADPDSGDVDARYLPDREASWAAGSFSVAGNSPSTVAMLTSSPLLDSDVDIE